MRLGQVSILIFLVMVSLVGCASHPDPAISIQTVSPGAVEPNPTLTPSRPTSAVVEFTPTVMPTLKPVQTTLPTAHSPLTPVPTSATFKPTPEAAPTYYYYGVANADPKIDWTEADRPAIREHLEYLRGLGVNTIEQSFSSKLIGTGREKNWLIFLDEAERANMHVIVRLWPPIEWNGRKFDFQAIQGFLGVVQDHPALLAYLGLHEPLEQFDSGQLQSFYAGVKGLAPKVAIAHLLGDMAWFDKSPRYPNRKFTAGICDICIVWYYPFRYVNGQPAFEEDLVRTTLQTNRKLVDERAPKAQLWFLGQAYAMYAHVRQLRMPSPEEMERLYTIAQQEHVDGFLWYPWLQGNVDQVLSDPEMEPQRQAVRRIYEDHVLQKQAP